MPGHKKSNRPWHVINRYTATLLIAGGAWCAAIEPATAENLLDAYRLAVDSDPQLRAAAANRAAVGEGRRQSQALYYPNINLSADASRNRQETDTDLGSTTDNFTNLGYAVNLSQALYRRDYLVQLRQSDALLREAEAQYRTTEQGLMLRVAERYFDVLAAQDNLQFAQAEKEALNRQLDQTQQRFEVGLIAITDVHESQAAFDTAVASEIAAENQLAVSREALREVTGELPSELDILSDDMQLTPPTPANVTQWVEEALSSNFEVIAAEATVDAARQQRALQRADRYPDIDLVARHGFSDSGGGFNGDRETTDTSLGVQLSLPLYQGGGISSRIRQANDQLDQAMQGLEQQRRATQRLTSDAYLNVLSGISQVKAFKQALVSSISALEATEAGYEVGTRTTVDVVTNRRNMFRAQRDYARSRYDYLIATLALKQAAGLLSPTDLEHINQWLQPPP